jgi:hypothetical protein
METLAGVRERYRRAVFDFLHSRILESTFKGVVSRDDKCKIEKEMKALDLGNVFDSYTHVMRDINRLTIYGWLTEMEKVLLGVVGERPLPSTSSRAHSSRSSEDGRRTADDYQMHSDVRGMHVRNFTGLSILKRHIGRASNNKATTVTTMLQGVDPSSSQLSTESMRVCQILADLHTFIEGGCGLPDVIQLMMDRRKELCPDEWFLDTDSNSGGDGDATQQGQDDSGIDSGDGTHGPDEEHEDGPRGFGMD